jgi:hypothetical protein
MKVAYPHRENPTHRHRALKCFSLTLELEEHLKKLMLRKFGGRVWIGFIWLKIGKL